jgi:iron-sulfur cluster repair protein YtfE (RIC family)
MDAFSLLKQDHEHVKKLFTQLSDTTEGARKTRQRGFEKLKHELEVHAQIEEEIFYPALKNDPATKDLVKEAIHEHQEARQMLEKMSGVPEDSEEWTELLEELKASVEHHVQEEEEDLFPKAQKALGSGAADELGDKLNTRKKELM